QAIGVIRKVRGIAIATCPISQYILAIDLIDGMRHLEKIADDIIDVLFGVIANRLSIIWVGLLDSQFIIWGLWGGQLTDVFASFCLNQTVGGIICVPSMGFDDGSTKILRLL